MRLSSWTLCEAIGAYYSWGAGDLANGLEGWPMGVPGVKGGVGWDCSGFAQACLLKLGIVRPEAWNDLSAHALANACNPVYTPEDHHRAMLRANVGDLCFYKSSRSERITHVTVYLGDGMCIGANGGGSGTNADNVNARVQVRPVRYRKDLIVIGTLKPEFRA
jgi:cell wall-associated NlpC family hydrolase